MHSFVSPRALVFVLLLGLVIFLAFVIFPTILQRQQKKDNTAASMKLKPAHSLQNDESQNDEPPPPFSCAWPLATDLNEWFTLDCMLRGNSPDAKPVHVKAAKDTRVQYDPKAFTIKPGETRLVHVKIKQTKTGIVNISLFPDGGSRPVSFPLNVGFRGRLKVSPNLSFSYDEPATVSIAMVDEDGKPMSVSSYLEMNVQAVGALVSPGRGGFAGSAQDWREVLPTMILNPGAGGSPQFQVRSIHKRGGTIQLLANVTLPNNGPQLTQESFSFQVTPSAWLPLAFAMAGSLLYWLYSFVKQVPEKWTWAIPHQILASLIGGGIAYLFAEFDLLGLKLDPNVLKTYALLGFLFAYVGIEVLLAEKFRPGIENKGS
jgi:hypothetical protein